MPLPQRWFVKSLSFAVAAFIAAVNGDTGPVLESYVLCFKRFWQRTS